MFLDGGGGGQEYWFRTIEDNRSVREQISNFNLPLTRYMTIPNAAGEQMNAKVVAPPGFKDDGSTVYPVLMQVYVCVCFIHEKYRYGGPNSQMVAQKYGVCMCVSSCC